MRLLFSAVTIRSCWRTNRGICPENPTYGSRSYRIGLTPKIASTPSTSSSTLAHATPAKRSFFLMLTIAAQNITARDQKPALRLWRVGGREQVCRRRGDGFANLNNLAAGNAADAAFDHDFVAIREDEFVHLSTAAVGEHVGAIRGKEGLIQSGDKLGVVPHAV